MPRATNRGVALYYETEGSGPAVALIEDVGYGAWLWGWHVDAVAGVWPTLTFDLRGTGRSDAPPGPYTVDDLAADLEGVLGDAGAAGVHLVGHGLGGAVALRHARRYPRAETLTVCGTAAAGDPVDRDALAALASLDRAGLEGAYSPDFLADGPVEQVLAWRRREDATGDARAAQADAWRSFESGPLFRLTLPALVFHGIDDPVVPSAAGEALAADLPRGRFEPVAGRHLAAVEHARATADELLAFLESTDSTYRSSVA